MRLEWFFPSRHVFVRSRNGTIVIACSEHEGYASCGQGVGHRKIRVPLQIDIKHAGVNAFAGVDERQSFFFSGHGPDDLGTQLSQRPHHIISNNTRLRRPAPAFAPAWLCRPQFLPCPNPTWRITKQEGDEFAAGVASSRAMASRIELPMLLPALHSLPQGPQQTFGARHVLPARPQPFNQREL